MKLLCCVSYKGTNYQGWQKQPDAPTIQGEIEKVLSHILNTEINIQGSGRTDAGVHALSQYFHFETEKELDLDRFRYSANCLLPKDIFIKSIRVVNDDFHARYSAKQKIYTYKLYFGERNPFKEGQITNIPYKIDSNLLIESLKAFEGTHNFQDFTSKEEDEDNFVRTIYSIEFKNSKERDELDITFIGNGFMRYQIRNMVGTALAVATGKEDSEYINGHLNCENERDICPYKAPADGLYLVDVNY